MFSLRILPSLSFWILPVMTFLSSGLGFLLLPKLRRLQVGQTVREDGPQTHRVKTGTPTFGGFMFLLPLLLLSLLLLCLYPERRGDILCLTLTVLSCALIGFVDDYVKVRVTKEGLSVRQKTLAMSLVCLLVTLYVLFAHGNPILYLPFAPYSVEITGLWKLLYGIFCFLYLYFCINAVNLTDGVDGLASTLVITTSLALALVVRSILPLPIWMESFAVGMAGGCLGFLTHNGYPAKVFMGDTGSLALGAGTCLLPLLMGVPWAFLFLGFLYVVEALSVVIQVSFFKMTGGRRIFRMSPIHHHFELGGWTEKQIVRRFSLVNLLASALGLYLLVLTARGLV